MAPAQLSEYLAALRAAGVTKAHLSFGFGPTTTVISVTLSEKRSDAQFVDEIGRPVNLDDGSPWDASQDIEAANFAPRKSDS